MQNCKSGVNQDCIAANPTEEWKCIIAQVFHRIMLLHELLPIIQYTYPHIKTPIFLLNARYDTWQLSHILQLPCHPPNCSADLMKKFEEFGNVRHYYNTIQVQ